MDDSLRPFWHSFFFFSAGNVRCMMLLRQLTGRFARRFTAGRSGRLLVLGCTLFQAGSSWSWGSTKLVRKNATSLNVVCQEFKWVFLLWVKIFLRSCDFKWCCVATADCSVQKEMRRYIDASSPIIDYIDNLFLSRSISLDWWNWTGVHICSCWQSCRWCHCFVLFIAIM